MLTSSTLTFSIGSGERKRCSNMAPVRRLRSLAWINARRFPGVRCSTLKTECRSLLCLMIMPGRSWVAGIDIAEIALLALIYDTDLLHNDLRQNDLRPPRVVLRGLKSVFYTACPNLGIAAEMGGGVLPFQAARIVVAAIQD